jgi:hypothetical protein
VDVLVGTAVVDVLIGGQGADELIGNGGADVLRGGEGDDILSISDLSFARLAGDDGTDTLRLNASGLVLDLTTIPDSRITGVEVIDITGVISDTEAPNLLLQTLSLSESFNTLILDLQELLNLSDTSNTLTVIGDDDAVYLDGGWTMIGSEVIGSDIFDVYTQGAATLKVANAIVVLTPISGDLNGDGFVGITDLNIILSNWNLNVPPGDPSADPSGDGFVGISDLNVVLGNWNAGTPPAVQPTSAGQTEQRVSASRQPKQSELTITTHVWVAITNPLDREPSILDEVRPYRPHRSATPVAVPAPLHTTVWSWLNDGWPGQRTAFGSGDDDGKVTDNALDIARPMPKHAALSRLS